VSRLLPGRADARGTRAYVERLRASLPRAHFSDFGETRLKLSSLGIGTFPGAASDAADAESAALIAEGLLGGINVIDSAVHYRYGRALGALRAGLERAFASGLAREQLFIVIKGGFVLLPEGPPADFAAWFDAHCAARGLGTRADLSGQHLLSPEHIAWQLAQARDALGLETIDAFVVDQPEVHVARIGKEAMHRKLEAVFGVLEDAARRGWIGAYGIASFDSLRVETDAAQFQSLTSLLGLAERAAGGSRHHLRLVQLPFNPAMTEGFTRFSQATGQGNLASTLQAAFQLGLYVMTSHTLGKGRFALEDPLAEAVPELANAAQRALQFARSTPGVGSALVGVRTPAQLADLLAVARVPPLAREAYVRLYRRA
jgi:aryl-alcohol dehydrogenase-like predicted oxidoreductase